MLGRERKGGKREGGSYMIQEKRKGGESWLILYFAWIERVFEP